MLASYLAIAVSAAKKSGSVLKNQDNVVVRSSIGKDIKLQSDIDSEEILMQELSSKSAFPILSEEFGMYGNPDENGFLWVVDPLDGSLNFSRGIPLNCISIGLWQHQKPILGVIYDFNRDELFTGIVGEGAFLNETAIEVSTVNAPGQSIICTGFPVYNAMDATKMQRFFDYVQQFKKVRLLGSAALSLSLVARGCVEVYAEDRIGFWDVAAGIAIAEAAGGKANYTFCEDNANLLNVSVSNSLLN